MHFIPHVQFKAICALPPPGQPSSYVASRADRQPMHQCPSLPHTTLALCDADDLLRNAIRQLGFAPLVRGFEDPLDGLAAALAEAQGHGNGCRGTAAGNAALLADLEDGGDAVNDRGQVGEWLEWEGGSGERGEKVAVWEGRVGLWG